MFFPLFTFSFLSWFMMIITIILANLLLVFKSFFMAICYPIWLNGLIMRIYYWEYLKKNSIFLYLYKLKSLNCFPSKIYCYPLYLYPAVIAHSISCFLSFIIFILALKILKFNYSISVKFLYSFYYFIQSHYFVFVVINNTS